MAGRRPGEEDPAVGVEADAVHGDALASFLPGHSGHAAPEWLHPPTPRESTLAPPGAGQIERGAPVDTEAELEAIRRLKYAYFRNLDLKQFDDAGRPADRGRHGLL